MTKRACVCGESVSSVNPCDYTCGDCERQESVPTSWWIDFEAEGESIDEAGGTIRYPWKG